MPRSTMSCSDYVPSKLVQASTILLNGEQVDALSFIVHEDKAYARARKIAEKLKDNIPRQLFEVPIQAAIGGKHHRPRNRQGNAQGCPCQVLRWRYYAQRRNCWKSRRKAKRRCASLGSVEVSPEAFMAVLKLDGDDN